MIRYRLTESLYGNVETSSVSTSDISSDDMITAPVTVTEPERYYRFCLRLWIETLDGYGDDFCGEDEACDVPLKELTETISDTLRMWRRFMPEGSLPAFTVGNPLVPGDTDKGPRFVPVGLPVPRSLNMGRIMDDNMDDESAVVIPVYFNRIRKSDYQRFVVQFDRLEDMIYKACHNVRPHITLGHFYIEQRTDAGNFCAISHNKRDRLSRLYQLAVLGQEKADDMTTESHGSPFDIFYSRVMGDEPDAILEAVRNTGIPLARKKYGIDLKILHMELDTDNRPRDFFEHMEGFLYLYMKSEGTMTMEEIERCLMECVISKMNRNVFRYVRFVITVIHDGKLKAYPGTLVKKYPGRIEVKRYKGQVNSGNFDEMRFDFGAFMDFGGQGEALLMVTDDGMNSLDTEQNKYDVLGWQKSVDKAERIAKEKGIID